MPQSGPKGRMPSKFLALLRKRYSLWTFSPRLLGKRPKLCEKLSLEEVLELCVGDTLDEPKRNAFPKHKEALLAAPNGDKMFQVAREALELLGAHGLLPWIIPELKLELGPSQPRDPGGAWRSQDQGQGKAVK
jgi:hypothetical protein